MGLSFPFARVEKVKSLLLPTASCWSGLPRMQTKLAPNVQLCSQNAKHEAALTAKTKDAEVDWHLR